MVLAAALAWVLAPTAAAQTPQFDPRAEASALGAIALQTRAKLRAKAPIVDAGRKRLERYAKQCPAIARAAKRAPGVDFEALDVALTASFFYAPILGTLDRFVGELEAVRVTEGTLRDGVAGWRKTVEILRRYVRLPTRVCAAVRRWARSGYARAHAPADAAALAAADRKSAVAGETIDSASRRLRFLGASAKAAKAFTIDGLLEAAFPDEVSGEGSSQAASVR